MDREMANFRSGRKGIFLTNTRHAYNGIKNINHELIWDNCGTFFHQWHPGKSFSVRFHNVLLIIDKKKENLDSGKIYSTGGLEQFDSREVRVAEGLWDSAFQAVGNKPAAVSLENSLFGRETYFGNLTHRSASGQTMSDAYDALIFQGPLEKLRLSASIDWIYTDEFKKEMERRYKMTYTEQETKEQLKALEVSSLQELINKQCVARPEKPRLAGLSIGPVEEWKAKKN